MNERLPKVFVNKIDKTLNVNQETTISSRKNSSLNWNKILTLNGKKIDISDIKSVVEIKK